MQAQKTRSQIVEEAVRDFCFQTNPPVRIRRKQARITASFLRRHFDLFVAHHLNHGSTGDAAQAAIEELEV
jgi:hypothetical protein